MSNPITEIKTQIKLGIAAMNTIGGYQYNWSGDNIWDESKQTSFPCAYVKLEDENNEDFKKYGCFPTSSINKVIFKIRIFTKLSTQPTDYNEIEDHEDLLLNCLADLKRMIYNNTYMNDTCDFIWYIRSKLINYKSNDILQPYVLDTYWLATYQQYISNPATRF